MPTVETSGVQVVAVYCSDLGRSKAFYCEQLGMIEGDMMGPGVLLTCGQTSIYLEGGRTPRCNVNQSEADVSLCLATASIKQAAAATEAAGIRLVTPYTEFAPTFAMFRLADPDGNVIEFAGAP